MKLKHQRKKERTNKRKRERKRKRKRGFLVANVHTFSIKGPKYSRNF